jgi:SAM-dependent methyltransferase
MISPETGEGTTGALRLHRGLPANARAVSIGCGTGEKERKLLHAGVVDSFDLYEISEDRAKVALGCAHAEGLGERVRVLQDDALKKNVDRQYDIVYWDHALHHMLDVDHAVSWSVRALRAGGLLVVNDYIGPTRLQMPRNQILLARQFLDDHHDRLQIPSDTIPFSSLFTRVRQIYRDPSEAPQSDRIESACMKHCGPFLRPIGGAMIHLCGPFVTDIEDQNDPIFQSLIDWDREVLAMGIAHFAFGVWRRPD